MYNKEVDILQIIKYHKGELDAKTMHQLEKAALDDPFLSEALEGLEGNAPERQVQLNEIKERIAKRIEKPGRKIIPLKYLAIAASIAVFLAIALFVDVNLKKEQLKLAENITNKRHTNEKIAASALPGAIIQKKEEVKINAPKTIAGPLLANKQQNISAPDIEHQNIPLNAKKPTDASIPVATEAVKDSTPINEMIVMDYSAEKKKETIAEKPSVSKKVVKEVATASPIKEQLLRSEAEGVTKTSAPVPDYSLQSVQLKKPTIKGRVVGSDDGLPVAGAVVKVAGTNNGTITSADGSFALHTADEKNKVLVAYIGYQTKEFNLNKGDSAKIIALEPSNSSLNETIVAGYSNDKARNLDDSTFKAAHPKSGWGEFRKYLKANKLSPDGKTGTVKISFEVNHSGTISNLKITHSLSESSDKKAEDLIKNGPVWLGNTSGKPETVSVKIKFE